MSVEAIQVFDDVVPDALAYRARLLALPFQSVTVGGVVTFHGMAACPDPWVADWLAAQGIGVASSISLVRRSPAGQVEPHYIHTDRDMGQWTAILYLTLAPPAGDGTTFWQHRDRGVITSTADRGEDWPGEWADWRDATQWEPWHTVAARFNRMVVFPAGYYHSRSLFENFGTDDEARLIQIVFGSGACQRLAIDEVDIHVCRH